MKKDFEELEEGSLMDIRLNSQAAIPEIPNQ